MLPKKNKTKLFSRACGWSPWGGGCTLSLYLTCWTSFRKIILHDEFVTQNLPRGGTGTAGDCEVTSEHLRHHNNQHWRTWKALPFSI